LANAREIRELLESIFRMKLPETPDLDAALNRILAKPDATIGG
jgi:hypothetical protein